MAVECSGEWSHSPSPPLGHQTDSAARAFEEMAYKDSMQVWRDHFPIYNHTGLFLIRLRRAATAAHPDDTHHIRYDEFSKVVAASPQCIKNVFKDPVVLLKLVQKTGHAKGRLPIDNLHRMVLRASDEADIAKGMMEYSDDGIYLYAEQLRDYTVAKVVNRLPAFNNRDRQTLDYFFHVVERRFFFFLDPMKKERISIADCVSSGFAEELLNAEAKEGEEVGGWNRRPPSWFSLRNVERLLEDFRMMDVDKNGLLSLEELKMARRGELSPLFMECVLNVVQTYERPPQLDFKGFTELYLALENKHSEVSQRYIWRALDVKGKGYLTRFDLSPFCSSILAPYRRFYQLIIDLDPLLDEIFDFVRPVDKTKITLSDVLKSGHAKTFFGILTECGDLMKYEDRENPPQEEEE